MRLQYVGQGTDVHGFDAFLVQSFKKVAAQRRLGMVTSAGARSVQSPDALAAVLAIAEFRLQPCDLARRLTEPFEQLTALVQVLLASRCGTGDEVVGADIQSGLLGGHWRCPCILSNSHGLGSSEFAFNVVVPQIEAAL